jgi:hypothetical protein
LRDEYRKIEAKEGFVKNLATVSKFYNIWNLSNNNPDEIIVNDTIIAPDPRLLYTFRH